MDPFDMAWQLLKEVGVEGPADPHRLGEFRDTRTQMHPSDDDGLPPEAYEQLNQALEEEARLRNMPTDQSELPPPPSPKGTMRQMPPRTGDLRGFPPHMIEAIERAVANSPEMREKYEAQRSAGGGRPPQGTSVQNPDDVLRSMSPIDLAMDALQKKTPRSHIGSAANRDAYEALLESIEGEGGNRGADPEYDWKTEGEYQDMMDGISDEEAERLAAEASGYDNKDLFYPTDIPVNDPMPHHELGMEHEAARAAGMEEPEIDEGEDLDDEDEWSAPGRGAVGGDAFQHRTFGLQDPASRGPSL